MTEVLSRLWSDRRITTVLTVSMATVIVFTVALITILDVVRQREIFEDKLEEKGLLLARTLNRWTSRRLSSGPWF